MPDSIRRWLTSSWVVACVAERNDQPAAQRCEIKTPDGKLQCGRPADHAGPHVHVAANGTTAWGGVTRV
jgi:hypothetical protein